MPTLETVKQCFSIAGRVLWYMVAGLYYVYAGAEYVKTVTMEHIVLAFRTHPFLWTITLSFAIMAVVFSCILCWKGIKRILFPVIILMIACGLLIGAGFSVTRMWEISNGA